MVQSSSAVTSRGGSSPTTSCGLEAAVGISLGSNIGTVLTTLIASIGTSRESKAVALADLCSTSSVCSWCCPSWDTFCL